MNKYINLISKGTAFGYVFLKNIFVKNGQINNKRILIILAGHLGNAIMNIESLLMIRKIFKLEEGWNVSIMCSKRLWNACNLITDMSEFEFFDVGFIDEGNGTDFKTVHNILSNIKGKSFEKIIVTMGGNSPLSHYIVATTPHNESIAVFDDVQNEKGIRWYFERSFTKKIIACVDDHDTIRLKKIIRYLGGDDYKIKIHYIPRTCEYNVPDEKYITIAIDSLETDRRWPAEKFAQLSDLLIDKYGYLICFTGGYKGKKIYEDIIKKMKKTQKTRNFVGETNIREWIELIRNAEFHIGVDSGSIHVAASVGTVPFCIAGHEIGNRCLPYVTEELDTLTKNPICIYKKEKKELECYACKARFGRTGKGNNECYKMCRDGKPSLCYSEINAEDVFEVITENIVVEEKENEQCIKD